MTRCVVWGAGELGGRVAQLAVSQGFEVHAYTATEQRHANLASKGIRVSIGDPVSFRPTDLVLLSISGTAALTAAIERVRLYETPKRIVLTSSTGYYHGRTGVIDSQTGPGETSRAQNIAMMEAGFKLWAKSAGVILRLGGLFRIGRGPLNAYQKKQIVPPGPPNKKLALIHYEDAAKATLAAMTIDQPKSEYVVVGEQCPTRQEFYLAASVLLGLPIPSFGKPLSGPPIDYDTTPMQLDLLPEPSHPQWQEALVPG